MDYRQQWLLKSHKWRRELKKVSPVNFELDLKFLLTDAKIDALLGLLVKEDAQVSEEFWKFACELLDYKVHRSIQREDLKDGK